MGEKKEGQCSFGPSASRVLYSLLMDHTLIYELGLHFSLNYKPVKFCSCVLLSHNIIALTKSVHMHMCTDSGGEFNTSCHSVATLWCS